MIHEECSFYERNGLKRLLIAAGYHVDAYSSASEFLNSAGSKVSGCLILDVGKTGLPCKKLLAEFTEREIRLSIIVISAGSGHETKKIANEMNAVGFFHKPVDGTALIDAID